MDITFFVREADGRYRRFQETHEQRAHSAEEIAAWLSAEGFEGVEIFGDQTFDSPAAEDMRINFGKETVNGRFANGRNVQYIVIGRPGPGDFD